MHRVVRALLAVLIPAVGLVAQRVRDLRLIDCFALDQAVVPPHDAPLEWLDGARYLVFAAVGAEDGGPSTFFAVDAVSGTRTVFLDPAHVDVLAALPGMRRDTVLAALGDAESFHWSPQHDRAVVSIADDLFVVEREPLAAHRLTRSPGVESGVAVSPDGSMVAFVLDGALHVVPIDGAPALRLAGRDEHDPADDDTLFGRLDWVYQEEVFGRGDWQGFWWSPDSTRIALLRLDEKPVQKLVIPSDQTGLELHSEIRYPTAGEKNPTVGLGIVDVAGGAPRWLDLGQWMHVDPLVVRVTWHPSGDELFFQVQDREQRWLEMVAADAASGELRTVFREDSPCWVEPGPEPVWIQDGAAFLWQSERDGFRHVYRYTRAGECVGAVTHGAFEVDDLLAVDEAAGEIWFESDGGRWREQNLYRVGLAGGEPIRVTPEDGWHEIELAPDFAHFVDTWSRAHVPAGVLVGSADGSRVRWIAEPNANALQLFQVGAPEFVSMPTRDGASIDAMLIRPRGFDPAKRYPLLVFQYSGPHTPHVLDRWAWRDFLWHQRLAQRGFCVAVVDPRSASGKGRESACLAFHRFGQTESFDHEDAVAWLVANASIDPKRIAVWGWSYGGYQALYDLTHSRVFAAGIAVNPVTDWRFYDSIYTERYMGLPQANIAGYAAASVIEAAAQLHGELLLAHATMDDNVHLRNSMFLVHALQQAGKRFRFMPYPRVRHGIEDIAQQLHLFTEIEAFLDATIGGAR